MEIIKTATQDGLKLTGFLSVPENSTKRIIIHIHGMAGSPYENDWYVDFHKLYPENDCAFLVGQLRGTGEMTMFETVSGEYLTIGDAFENFEESVFDIDAWIGYARNLGFEEIFLQAHSFWPSKVLFYLNQRPSEDIKSTILISPVDMLGLTEIDPNYNKMASEAQELAFEGKWRQILSCLLDGDTHLSAGTFQNLFGPWSKANIFSYTNRVHDWGIVNAIDIPVFLIGWTKDGPMENVLPSENCFEILKKEFRNSPKVGSVIYSWAPHSFDGFSNRIVEDVVNFIRD